MNNIKKILIYPLAFVLFFGLTANTCFEDAVENIAIDVPTTIEETFIIQLSESGSYSIVKEVDLNSPEVQEYRDRIESFTAESLTFDVTDNIEVGSANSNSTELNFKFGNETHSFPFGNVNLEQKLEGTTLAKLEGLKEIFETYIIDPASKTDPTVDIEFIGDAQGPIDLTVEMTIEGVIKASAN